MRCPNRGIFDLEKHCHYTCRKLQTRRKASNGRGCNPLYMAQAARQSCAPGWRWLDCASLEAFQRALCSPHSPDWLRVAARPPLEHSSVAPGVAVTAKQSSRPFQRAIKTAKRSLLARIVASHNRCFTVGRGVTKKCKMRSQPRAERKDCAGPVISPHYSQGTCTHVTLAIDVNYILFRSYRDSTSGCSGPSQPAWGTDASCLHSLNNTHKDAACVAINFAYT